MFGFVFPWVQRVTRFFVSGITWSVRVSSGGSRLEHVVSLELPRDVTGKLICRRWIRCSVMLRFGTVLDFFRWLVLRRASSGPARVGGRSCESRKRSFEEFQRVKRFKRESAHTARCFKLSGFGHRPQAAGPIRASVRGGSPACTATFARHFHVTKNNFLPLH